MTYPPNLLKLDPAFRVLLPEGATGATGELDYQGPYRVAAVLAGGTSDVKVIIPDPAGAPRLGQVVALDDSPNVFLLGARPGDPVPPYLTLRLYPEFPLLASAIDRGEPIILSGRPHEHPEGSGLWDLEDLGGDARPTIASRAQIESVSQVLADYGLILPNLASATAQLQGVLGELADTKAGIEQYAGGIERRDSLTEIDAAPDGLYLNTGETGGPIYQRKNGATTPRPDLKGATAAAVATAQGVADAAAAQASALAPDVTKAARATSAVITPEQFGATGQFDPLQFGTAGWAAHAAANNASLAFQQAFAQAKNNPGVNYTLRLAGRYYLGPLSGTLQRANGRTIYGAAAALTTLGTYAQAEYERMPVAAEYVNLTIEGAGCEIYMGADLAAVDTGIGVLHSRVDFTGAGTIYGFSPAAPDRNTEQLACIRYLAGASGTVGEGWTLAAFLGDGVLIGGLRTDQGGTATEHASMEVTVRATIHERHGDGTRPWYKAGTKVYGVPGDTYGSRSRLCTAIIHAHDITVSSQHLSGGMDTEANVNGQLMVNVFVKNARFRDRWVLPFGPGNVRAHPWQPERAVLPGTAGAVLLSNKIIYTSPADAPIVAGGGIFGVQMDTGYVYMHNKMLAPIDGLTFDKGLLILGNQGVDTGKTTTGASVKNVSARTVLRRDLYGLTPNPYADSNALVVLSGNVRGSLLENITVDDATAEAVALSHVPNNTGGNSEAGNRYVNCRNTGKEAGAARVLGFAPDGTSRELGSASVGRATTKLHPVIPQRELRLSAGKIDYAANPAGEYLVYNETLPNFLGFVDPSLIPEGAVFVFRGSGPEGLGIASTGTVSHRNTGAGVALAPGESMTMQMRGGVLYEVSRSVAASPIPAITNPATATTTETATRLNELLAVLKARGVT